MKQFIDRFQSTENSESVTDEKILNVFRRRDEKVLGTADIAEELPITRDWTGKRLNKLETKGRVHSKSAGQGRVWWLDDTESGFPVADGLGDLIWYSSLMKETSVTVLLTGAGMFVLGGVLLIPIFLLNLFSYEFGLFTADDLAMVAIAAALVGALFLIVGGGLRLLSMMIRRRYSI